MRSRTVDGNPAGEQSVEVPQLGTGATAQLLVEVATRHGYSVVAVGPNRFRLARTKRPTWAVVLACVTAVFALLGLLFLLIRRTESGDAVVAETRSGVTLRLTGLLSADFTADLRNTLGAVRSSARIDGDTAPPMRTQVGFAPVLEAPADSAPADQRSFEPLPAPVVAPPALSALAPPTAPVLIDHAMPLDTVVTRPGVAVLLLSSGAAIAVGGGGVIGRDPTSDPLLPSAQLYPIGDPSLSKTHLSFGPSSIGIWVVDNYSTNGTFVIVNGQHEACAPGVRTDVPFGASVVAGDLEMVVQRQ